MGSVEFVPSYRDDSRIADPAIENFLSLYEIMAARERTLSEAVIKTIEAAISEIGFSPAEFTAAGDTIHPLLTPVCFDGKERSGYAFELKKEGILYRVESIYSFSPKEDGTVYDATIGAFAYKIQEGKRCVFIPSEKKWAPAAYEDPFREKGKSESVFHQAFAKAAGEACQPPSKRIGGARQEDEAEFKSVDALYEAVTSAIASEEAESLCRRYMPLISLHESMGGKADFFIIRDEDTVAVCLVPYGVKNTGCAVTYAENKYHILQCIQSEAGGYYLQSVSSTKDLSKAKTLTEWLFSEAQKNPVSVTVPVSGKAAIQYNPSTPGVISRIKKDGKVFSMNEEKAAAIAGSLLT